MSNHFEFEKNKLDSMCVKANKIHSRQHLEMINIVNCFLKFAKIEQFE